VVEGAVDETEVNIWDMESEEPEVRRSSVPLGVKEMLAVFIHAVVELSGSRCRSGEGSKRCEKEKSRKRNGENPWMDQWHRSRAKKNCG
jgi:hypothetical protein